MYIEPRYSRFRSTTMVGENNPPWQDDKSFLDVYADIESLTLVSPQRLYHLHQYAKRANCIAGDFAQVGVYKGGSAKLISLIKSNEKTFHLFDTFTGLPSTNPAYDVLPEGSFNDTSEAAIRELFSSSEMIKIYQGRFPMTTRSLPEQTKYAFVYLDVDLYESNIDALSYFYPRMQKGAFILIDDYLSKNTPGIYQSVQDYITAKKLPPPIITTKYQCLLIKS